MRTSPTDTSSPLRRKAHALSHGLAALFLFTALLPAQDTAAVTRLLKQLQSQDIETRRTAMFELQTSLDPRIPDACLPVLQMKGDTIRRLAARAIGSRWQQIPAERVPIFVAALKPHLKSEHEGLVNMARRGIALLTRTYTSDMASRSKSKRWVIYERHGLPCLIDTRTGTEELLGFGSGAKMEAAYGNREVAPSAIWHPRQDSVALGVILGRRFSTVWIWTHGKGLHQITDAELKRILGDKGEPIAAGGGIFSQINRSILDKIESNIVAEAGIFSQIDGWNGTALDFTVSYVAESGDIASDYEARLRYDTATDRLSVRSKKKMP